MPTDTAAVLEAAEKIGDMLKDHPTVTRYKAAQKTLSEDGEAARLMAEFNRQIETLSRQEQSGLPITDAQQQQLQALQERIVSNLQIKAFNLAQTEFVDLLRKVSEAYRKKLVDGPASGAPAAPVAPAAPQGSRLVY